MNKKMTIKDCTSQMLTDIRRNYSKERRTTDKEIAKIIGITPASYSRLYTKVTMPKIMTWQKIVNLHAKTCGIERNYELLNRLSNE